LKKLLLSTLLLILIPGIAIGKPSERSYQEKYCKGIIDFTLEDRTEVDCLTDTHAIEYDFSYKWAESIGQALGYSMMTGRRAGIVLIVKGELGLKHWNKLNAVIEHNNLPIDTFKVNTKIQD